MRLPSRPFFRGLVAAGRRRGGFSMLEVLVGVVLIGVISAIAIVKLGAFQKARKLDGEARDLFNSIANARAQALKKDVTFLLTFDTLQEKYSLYEDKDADGVADAGEKLSTRGFAQPVAFGKAEDGPAQGPGGSGNPAAMLEGAWLAGLALRNDRSATVSEGALYLHAAGLKTKTVCIRMPTGSRQLDIQRWDGNVWKKI